MVITLISTDVILSEVTEIKKICKSLEIPLHIISTVTDEIVSNNSQFYLLDIFSFDQLEGLLSRTISSQIVIWDFWPGIKGMDLAKRYGLRTLVRPTTKERLIDVFGLSVGDN